VLSLFVPGAHGGRIEASARSSGFYLTSNFAQAQFRLYPRFFRCYLCLPLNCLYFFSSFLTAGSLTFDQLNPLVHVTADLYLPPLCLCHSMNNVTPPCLYKALLYQLVLIKCSFVPSLDPDSHDIPIWEPCHESLVMRVWADLRTLAIPLRYQNLMENSHDVAWLDRELFCLNQPFKLGKWPRVITIQLV
jgi:hypothetical protein